MEQDLVYSLADAYHYLECLIKYDSLMEKYNANTRQHRAQYDQLKGRKITNKIKPWVIYLFFVPQIFLFTGLTLFGEGPVGTRILLFLIAAAMLAAPLVISRINRHSVEKRNEKFYQEAVQYWQQVGGPAVQSNQTTVLRIQKEKEAMVTEYSSLLNVLPPDYRDLTACGFILTALGNGRADTLKEAINLYEETLYRYRMQNAIQNYANAVANLQNQVMEQMEIMNSRLSEANSRLRGLEDWEFYKAIMRDTH